MINMSSAKKFVLVCVAFLAISCLTRAQPVSNEANKLRDVYEEQRHKGLPADQAQFHNVHDQEGDDKTSPRLSRSVKMPYLNKYMEKVNQKAIRSPSLRLRFGRRSDPDLPPNFDLFNEEFQQDPNNQQMLLQPFDYTGGHRSSSSSQEQQLQQQQQKRYLGFAREERKPAARLRWGRSAPGEFSSARDQIMDTIEALSRAQRSKQSRLRWGRSGPMTYNNEFKDLSDSDLATLAIQYLINNQQQQDQYAADGVSGQNAEEELNAKH